MSIRVLAPSAVVVLSPVWFSVASVSASFTKSSLRMLTDVAGEVVTKVST